MTNAAVSPGEPCPPAALGVHLLQRDDVCSGSEKQSSLLIAAQRAQQACDALFAKSTAESASRAKEESRALARNP